MPRDDSIEARIKHEFRWMVFWRLVGDVVDILPKLIVALGKSAVVRLLGTDASLASLRGKVHRYRDIPVVVTYHPAYLLRSLPEKSKSWEDLLFARKVLRAATAGDPL